MKASDWQQPAELANVIEDALCENGLELRKSVHADRRKSAALLLAQALIKHGVIK